MQTNRVVSREEWLDERKALLEREKEYTKERDRLTAARMALPWVRIDKDYQFDTPTGRKSLADLFDGRSQLIVYHFMLPPEWEAGCPGCSFIGDHLGGTLPHLNHHDVTLIAVSRGPLDLIERYKQRMGWNFPWASSAGCDFNYDFDVSFRAEDIAAGTATHNYRPARDTGEAPGLSAFYKDEQGQIFHTYSTYDRGLEELLGTYMILDRAPKGRNEESGMDWMKRHDEYEDVATAHACCGADAKASVAA
ncbi:hypothetical protein ACFB49_42270 [Sphingomonas sp. DBB INV C78]|uniref:DUF899 domain-containing protein n=1 Tax=Sphingomonas sp. DBB INV C78 TaxID=3349434 RepID=UPI0036D3C7BC